MILTRWQPVRAQYNPFRDSFFEFAPLAREFSRLLQDPFAESASLGAGRAPAVDLHEDEQAWVLTADLPGVQRKEVELIVEKDLLTLRASKEQGEIKDGELLRNERYFGTIERVLRLPAEVESDKIKATLKDGVLQVYIPKAESAKPRQIQIH